MACTPDGRVVTAVVPVDREGVSLDDDWDGFGQRPTASGTGRYVDVRVTEDEVLADRRRARRPRAGRAAPEEAADGWRRRAGPESHGDQYVATLVDLGRPPVAGLVAPARELDRVTAELASVRAMPATTT